MTDGRFYYSADGKIMKSFGADDSDALGLLRNYLNIEFLTQVSAIRSVFIIRWKLLNNVLK